MSKYMIDGATLTAIADAIRSKRKTTAAIKVEHMAMEIAAIDAKYPTETVRALIDGTIASFSLPEGLTAIRSSAFQNCRTMLCDRIPDTVTEIRDYAFQNANLVTIQMLPTDLELIGQFAFFQCNSLRISKIPEKVKTIGARAFDSCREIRELRFEGVPESIATDAFIRCSGITDIYVPWSEGVISGAPWGAVNATIHYNYTGA